MVGANLRMDADTLAAVGNAISHYVSLFHTILHLFSCNRECVKGKGLMVR